MTKKQRTTEHTPDAEQAKELSAQVKTFTHKVTTEDLKLNPELVSEEVAVGDVISLPMKGMKISKPVKTVFEVFNSSGGFVRTYSIADHGEEAKELASEFAARIGGTVK